MPGARPTINSVAPGSPNESTGELNQPGSRARACLRKSASRGQSGQSRSGTRGTGAAPESCPRRAGSFSVLEFVVIGSPRRHGGRALQELRRVMTRLARGGALGGGAAELGLQLDQIGEDVGLAPQFVGDHRRLAR